MSAEFVVRIAAPEDHSQVSALLEVSYPLLMAPDYDTTVLAAALPGMIQANPALLSSGTYFVAETDASLMVGCGGWTPERPGSGEVTAGLGHIRHFATHPDWLGRGIGRSIYACCEAQARDAGIQRLECYASLNAEGFYAALGFEPVRRIVVPMAGDLTFPALLMRRPL